MNQAKTTPKKLRSLWALRVTDGVSADELVKLLSEDDEHLHAWAIQFLCEDRKPPRHALERMLELAAKGDSGLVRLALASALQRLSPDDRWPLAEALAKRRDDVYDQNLPLMIWYGIEPLIQDDLDRYVELTISSAIPQIRINMSRRIASSPMSDEGLELLCQALAAPDTSRREDLLTGILQGLEGRRKVTMPSSWPKAHSKLDTSVDPETREKAAQLALIFHDEDAKRSMVLLADNPNADSASRTRYQCFGGGKN